MTSATCAVAIPSARSPTETRITGFSRRSGQSAAMRTAPDRCLLAGKPERLKSFRHSFFYLSQNLCQMGVRKSYRYKVFSVTHFSGFVPFSDH